LIKWDNIKIKEDDIKENKRIINYRFAIFKKGKKEKN